MVWSSVLLSWRVFQEFEHGCAFSIERCDEEFDDKSWINSKYVKLYEKFGLILNRSLENMYNVDYVLKLLNKKQLEENKETGAMELENIQAE